jgi:L-iditol 2-dehydrogenase
MTRILAAVMPAPHQPVEVREFPLPALEPDSALLRVELSEICGTDVHLREGRLAGVPYPIIPGHVCTGVLERIRGTLLDIDGRVFGEGDRATFLDVHGTCHRCRACLIDKASTRCAQRRVYGITYGVRDGLCGGWAQAVYLKPGVRCIRLDGVDSEAFMSGGCALPTALHALDRAGIRLGETVLVLGAGPVGLACAALAKLSGAGIVLCIGAPRVRIEVAQRMGATHALDLTSTAVEDRLEWVMSHTGRRGADVTIEATGRPEAVVQAMRWTRDAGRVVVVGQYTDLGDIPFNPHRDLNRKHLDIRGCWGSDYSHFHRAVELMRDEGSSKPWNALSLARVGLTDLNSALDEVAAGRSIKTLVVPNA